MFVYLSKKIAIPNNLALHVVSWNSTQGWIACGGERGLLKVLKLESSDGSASRTSGSQSSLTMNQTMEGHQGNIMVATWNENFRKLSTSDQNGLIIVWMLHKGVWFEEMINNRNRSVVRDMKWTADGQKICIAYEDGAVIVGTVDGQRLWGKEVKTQLAYLEWSPDGKYILFCTLTGEVHVYDNEGVYSHRVQIQCLDEGVEGVPLAGIQWYQGHRNPENPQPTLCITFENGRAQIMRSDSDDRPVLIDTMLRCSAMRWNPDGTAAAFAGMLQQTYQDGGDKEVCVVQFYAPSGQHLRSLRVPGSNLRCISWEGTGLRLALAVDSHIFFANIRPDYLWGYFAQTLVYAVLKRERNEHAVVFWDTQSDERYTKYIKHVLSIRSADEYCVLASKDDSNDQHILIVCNGIGSAVDTKHLALEPVHMAMTNTHVVAASEDLVYVWSYRSSIQKSSQTGKLAEVMGRPSRRTELMFHIDDTLADGRGGHDKEGFVPPDITCQDPISCICASDCCLLIARESGTIHRYSLPHLSLECTFTVSCRPQLIAVNCTSSRLAVVDINGLLILCDVELRASGSGQTGQTGNQLDFDRKDVWNFLWAADNPELFVVMEKTRMYVFRGLQPEEPVLSNAYLCAFKDLQIQSVLMDEVIQNPDAPRKEVLLDFETKSLRDTRDILAKVPNLKDAFNYVDRNPHPRLWRLLAEASLDKLDLAVAEKAFVRFEDYQGIQFVKRLRQLDDKVKQKAEVATYFQRFDEAETLYREIDRKDLAIDLRVRLGDWFRVLQLTQSSNEGSEDLLQRAWSAIGDYYADRGKWGSAAQYYSKARNNEALARAYYVLEDYDSLGGLCGSLPEGSPLLTDIGNKFVLVGLCDLAVKAFTRSGDVKAAVDACVLLNHWDLAVDLARQGNYTQIEGLLSKYAQHLLEKNKQIEAVQLYRKANRHAEAAKLLSEVAAEMGKTKGQKHPLRIKKLYLLSALEVEKYKKKTLDLGGAGGTQITAQTLNSLITQDQSLATEKALESPWRGAEGYHLYLLAQRQLYQGNFEAAMRTAIRLGDYEDVLDTQSIYSLMALTTYYNRFFAQCSRAFIKLEASADIEPELREKFEELAVRVFTRNPPRDATSKTCPCPRCKAACADWSIACASCGHRLPFCVATGRTIFPSTGPPGAKPASPRSALQAPAPGGSGAPTQTVSCKICRHKILADEARRLRNCPLCHSRIGI